MSGQVVTEPDGNKRIGAVAADPIRLQIPYDALTQYISTALTDPAKDRPMSGSILLLDMNYKQKATREFHDALLTEIAFPELDAATGKNHASITIVLQPSRTSVVGGDAPSSPALAKPVGQKAALASNFRVTLGEMPTQRVNKIEAITATRKVAQANPGEDRGFDRDAGGNWQLSNIVLSVPQVDALAFEKWSQDTLGRAQGRGDAGGGEASEKTMTIELLDPTLTKVLMTINCTGVGLVSVKPEAARPSGSEQVANVRVELYVEKVAFTLPKGGAAAAGPAPTGDAAAAGAAAGSPPAPAPAAGATGTDAAAPRPGARRPRRRAATLRPSSSRRRRPPRRRRRPTPVAPTLEPAPAPAPPTVKPAPAPARNGACRAANPRPPPPLHRQPASRRADDATARTHNERDDRRRRSSRSHAASRRRPLRLRRDTSRRSACSIRSSSAPSFWKPAPRVSSGSPPTSSPSRTRSSPSFANGRRALRLDASQLLLCATHSHSAPATISLTGCGQRSDAFLSRLRDGMQQAAREAMARRAVPRQVRPARAESRG